MWRPRSCISLRDLQLRIQRHITVDATLRIRLLDKESRVSPTRSRPQSRELDQAQFLVQVLIGELMDAYSAPCVADSKTRTGRPYMASGLAWVTKVRQDGTCLTRLL